MAAWDTCGRTPVVAVVVARMSKRYVFEMYNLAAGLAGVNGAMELVKVLFEQIIGECLSRKIELGV